MKYISPQAASDWIRALGTIEAPYSIKPSPLPWKQYPTPETASPVNTLVKRLVDAKSALLVFNDWSFYRPEDWQYYKPHQLGFVEAMRGIASQHPGFSQGLALFSDAIEHDELTSHVSISLELG